MQGTRPISGSLLIRSAARQTRATHANLRIHTDNLAGAASAPGIIVFYFSDRIEIFDSLLRRRIHSISFSTAVLAICAHDHQVYTLTRDGLIFSFDLHCLHNGYPYISALAIKESLLRGSPAIISAVIRNGTVIPVTRSDAFIVAGRLFAGQGQTYAAFQTRKGWFLLTASQNTVQYSSFVSRPTACLWHPEMLLLAASGSVYAYSASGALATAVNQKSFSGKTITALRYYSESKLVVGFSDGGIVIYDVEHGCIDKKFVASLHEGGDASIFEQTQLLYSEKGCDDAQLLENGKIAVLFQQNLIIIDSAQYCDPEVLNCAMYGAGDANGLLFVDKVLCVWAKNGLFQLMVGDDGTNAKEAQKVFLTAAHISFPEGKRISLKTRENAVCIADFQLQELQQNTFPKAQQPETALDVPLDCFLSENSDCSISENLPSQQDAQFYCFKVRSRPATVESVNIEQLMTFRADVPLSTFYGVQTDMPSEYMRSLIKSALSGRETYLEYARLQQRALENQKELDALRYCGASAVTFGAKSTDGVVVQLGSAEQRFQSVYQYIQYQKAAIGDYRLQQQKAAQYKSLLESYKTVPADEKVSIRPQINEAPIERIVCQGYSPIPQRIRDAYALRDSDNVYMDESLAVSYMKPPPDSLMLPLQNYPCAACAAFPVPMQGFSYYPSDIFYILSTAKEADKSITHVDITEFACQIIEVYRSERDPLVVKQLIAQFLAKRMFKYISTAPGESTSLKRPSPELIDMYYSLLQQKLNDSSGSIDFDQILRSQAFNAIERRLRNNSHSDEPVACAGAARCPGAMHYYDYTKALSPEQRERLEAGYGNRSMRLIMEYLQRQGMYIDFCMLGDAQRNAFCQFVQAHVLTADLSADEFRNADEIRELAKALAKKLDLKLNDASSMQRSAAAEAELAAATAARIQRESHNARERIETGAFEPCAPCALRDLSYYYLMDILIELKFDFDAGIKLADDLTAVYERLGRVPVQHERVDERGFRMALSHKVKVKAESMKFYVDNVVAVQMLMLVRDRAVFDRYALKVLAPQVRDTLVQYVVDKLYRYLSSVQYRLAELKKQQKLALAEAQVDRKATASTSALHGLKLVKKEYYRSEASKSATNIQRFDNVAEELQEINKYTRRGRKQKSNGPIRYEKRYRSEKEFVGSKTMIGSENGGERVDYGLKGSKVKAKLAAASATTTDDEEFSYSGKRHSVSEAMKANNKNAIRLPDNFAAELDFDSQAEHTATSDEPMIDASDNFANSSATYFTVYQSYKKPTKPSVVDLSAQLGALEQAVKRAKLIRAPKKYNFPAGFRQQQPSASSVHTSAAESADVPEVGLEDAFEAEEESVENSAQTALETDGPAAIKPRISQKSTLTNSERRLLKAVGKKDPMNMQTFKSCAKYLFRSRSQPNLQVFYDFQTVYQEKLYYQKLPRIFKTPNTVQHKQVKETRYQQMVYALSLGKASISDFIPNPKRLGAFMTEYTTDPQVYPKFSRYGRYIEYQETVGRETRAKAPRPHSARHYTSRYGTRKTLWNRETQRINIFAALYLLPLRICDDCCVNKRDTRLFRTYRNSDASLLDSGLSVYSTAFQAMLFYGKTCKASKNIGSQFYQYFGMFYPNAPYHRCSRYRELEDVVERDFPRNWSYQRMDSAPKWFLARGLDFACGPSNLNGTEDAAFYQVSYYYVYNQRTTYVPLQQANLNCAEFRGGIEILLEKQEIDVVTGIADISPAFALSSTDFCVSHGFELLLSDALYFSLQAAAKSVLEYDAAQLRKALPYPLRGEADLRWNTLRSLFLTYKQDVQRESRHRQRAQNRYIRKEERRAQKVMRADVPVRAVYSKLYYENGAAKQEQSCVFQIPYDYLQTCIIANAALTIAQLGFAFSYSYLAAAFYNGDATAIWHAATQPTLSFPLGALQGLRFSLCYKLIEGHVAYLAAAERRKTQFYREKNRYLQIQALKDSGYECLEQNLALMTFQTCIDCSVRFGIAKWLKLSAINENRKIFEQEARQKKELELERQKAQRIEAEKQRELDAILQAEKGKRDEFRQLVFSLQCKSGNYKECGLELVLTFMGLGYRFSRQFYDDRMRELQKDPGFEQSKYAQNLVRAEFSLEVLRRQFYYNQRYSFYAMPLAKQALEKTQEALSFAFSFRNLGKLSLTGNANCGLAEYSQGILNEQDFRNRRLLDTLELSFAKTAGNERKFFADGSSKSKASPIREEMQRKREYLLRSETQKRALQAHRLPLNSMSRPSSRLAYAVSRGDVATLRKLAESHYQLFVTDLEQLAQSDSVSDEMQQAALSCAINDLSGANQANASNAAPFGDLRTYNKAHGAAPQQQHATTVPGAESLRLGPRASIALRSGARSQMQCFRAPQPIGRFEAYNRSLKSALGNRPCATQLTCAKNQITSLKIAKAGHESRAEETYNAEKLRNDAELAAVGRNVSK